MQSAVHGMIDKAHRYADEPDRIQMSALTAEVRGNNGTHTVTLANGRLTCDCDHYQHEVLCAHVLTAERVFKRHLPADAVPYPTAVLASDGAANG